MSTRLLTGAAVPVLVLVLAACGGNEHEGHTAAEHSSALASASSAAASTGAATSAPTPSAGASSAPAAGSTGSIAGASTGAAASTGSAAGFNQQDVAFAQNMIMHHRQALDLAALAEGRTSTAAVQRLAAAVAGSQAPEVDVMTRWLSTWGEAVPEDMSQMDMAGSMPGMQSLADMQAVADLEGTAFDRKFLTMMKDHHEGAIAMAKQQLSQGSSADAKALASRVIVEQSAEMDLISSLLT